MKTFDADTAVVVEVIITNKKRRGNGKDDPYRAITEVFTKDGQLIAEYDPCSCTICGTFNCGSDHK